MKKFMLGFILAAVLFSAFPVGAAVQQYILTPSAAKIVVDGTKVNDANLPIMAYEGYNYVPASVLKGICDKIKVGFKWDGATKEIQISTTTTTTTKEVNTTMAETVPLNKYGLPDFSKIPNDARPEITNDGKNRFFTCSGVKYIILVGMPDMPFILPKPYKLECPIINGKVSYTVQMVKLTQSERTVLIDEVPYALYSGSRSFCIQYDYYQNTILPIMNEETE